MPLLLLDTDGCANCAGILEELENIDDDCDRHGIVFVKTKDFSIAETYGVLEYPALVYFESSVPNVFEGKKFCCLSMPQEHTQSLSLMIPQVNCARRKRSCSG